MSCESLLILNKMLDLNPLCLYFLQKLQASEIEQLGDLYVSCLEAKSELELQIEQLTSENEELRTALESIEENSITES